MSEEDVTPHKYLAPDLLASLLEEYLASLPSDYERLVFVRDKVGMCVICGSLDCDEYTHRDD